MWQKVNEHLIKEQIKRSVLFCTKEKSFRIEILTFYRSKNWHKFSISSISMRNVKWKENLFFLVKKLLICVDLFKREIILHNSYTYEINGKRQ